MFFTVEEIIRIEDYCSSRYLYAIFKTVYWQPSVNITTLFYSNYTGLKNIPPLLCSFQSRHILYSTSPDYIYDFHE